MSFRGVVLCSLLGLPLAIVACGGVDGEPAVADAARDTGNHVTKTDGGSPEASRAEAGRPDGSGNTHDGSADAKERDTGLDAGLARDHGEASTTYPAFTPFMPQVQYGGGPVLSNAEIVMITWYGDENASTFEAFGDDLGTSDYWAQTTSEYHVGPAHSGPENHVRLPQSEAPIANWSDTAIEAWVTTHVQSYGTYGWPAPTSNSVYVLYLPPNEDIQFSGSDACQSGIGGYHGNVIVNSKDVAYAVVLQCQDNSGAQTTAEASHELIEAATDPHPSDITAWVGFDQDHLAWDVFQSFQDEVADACEFYFDAFYEQTFSTVETLDAGPDSGEGGILLDAGLAMFATQRTWSNVNAAAGHAPCRPTDYSVYFNVSPLQLDPSVSLNLTSLGGLASSQGQGYRIAKGATRTFPVGFWSDGPTSGPWTISAVEGNPLMGPATSSDLTISIDWTQGQNGDIAYVTVTVNTVDTSMNGELITITSELSGFHRTFMPILISNE